MKLFIINTIKNVVAYFILSMSIFLMLRLVFEYYPLDDNSGFLQFKQPLIDNVFWKTCFYIHVFSSVFLLAVGLTQFSSYVLQKYRMLHLITGRLYAVNLLFVNFPCAMVMAIYANGGLAGKTAFILLDILWFIFTLKAVVEVKKGNIEGHKNFMIRSYALTLSAISLRTWKLILLNTTSLDIDTIYIMEAWLGFVPNLLLAEWLISRKQLSNYLSK